MSSSCCSVLLMQPLTSMGWLPLSQGIWDKIMKHAFVKINVLIGKNICRKKVLEGGEKVRWPGVEPGSTAWKATMLTVTPPTLGWSKAP